MSPFLDVAIANDCIVVHRRAMHRVRRAPPGALVTVKAIEPVFFRTSRAMQMSVSALRKKECRIAGLIFACN